MSDSQPPDRDVLMGLYRAAVEERRFQVLLNWSRTQYLVGLSALLLTAGIALDDRAAIPIFVVGAVESLIARTIVATEHGYYRATRDGMRRIGAELHLGDLAISGTPGVGGPARDGPRVVTWVRLLLLLLAVAHAVAAAVAW
jgi:hypothetical protein